ncbi:MAG TPA: hypothetical protein V6C86_07820 [Oculatellaceae cyanobacterium]
MGNFIGDQSTNRYVKLSNGATSVLISTLLLAGSDLADNVWKENLVMWLAGHDQSVTGIGTVDFDLDEIAWTKEDFHEQRKFLLDMIDLASEKHRWSVLPYDPPLVLDHLAKFRELVERFELLDRWSSSFEPLLSPPRPWTKCDLHQIYKHEQGCYICLDAEQVIVTPIERP